MKIRIKQKTENSQLFTIVKNKKKLKNDPGYTSTFPLFQPMYFRVILLL